MGISFDEFHHFGMEKYDGGAERWDFDHDGEMSIFEENCRRVHDDMMMEMRNESVGDHKYFWDDDDDDVFKDGLDDDLDDDLGDDFGDDF